VPSAGPRVVLGDGGHEPGEVVHGDHRNERADRAREGGKPAGPQVSHQVRQADVLTRLARDGVPEARGAEHHTASGLVM
jgi:hypothetical protein